MSHYLFKDILFQIFYVHIWQMFDTATADALVKKTNQSEKVKIMPWVSSKMIERVYLYHNISKKLEKMKSSLSKVTYW